jgi:hypothetical protein
VNVVGYYWYPGSLLYFLCISLTFSSNHLLSLLQHKVVLVFSLDDILPRWPS